MARTKQSSRKSTGGIAPRASFALVSIDSASDNDDNDGSAGSTIDDNDGSADYHVLDESDSAKDDDGHEVSIHNIYIVVLTYFLKSGVLLHLHEWRYRLLVSEVYARRMRRSLHSASWGGYFARGLHLHRVSHASVQGRRTLYG